MKNEFGNRSNIVHLNNIRIAPRKVRVLVDLIRRKHVVEAIDTLVFTDRRASVPLVKLIESGIANVRENLREWDADDLYVVRATVDSGATLRRFKPRAQGRATRINKRTSRVTLELRPLVSEE